mmetsp:Transcript_2472/g.5100  ORF Transcript_2472/g.5100 Transcript_2472/m.5100 type:complete len:90 (-) Transcript_2472:968-1237(-)
MMISAPYNVLIAGTSPNTNRPTAADQISSTYRKGASAEASTRLKDLSRQYSNKLAPPPRIASKINCIWVGATHTPIAGMAQMIVVKRAV